MHTQLDVLQISGIDPNQLATDFTNSGTINEAEGWVTGLDPTILQTAQTTAQTKLTDYINTNLTNPTVGDVIGGRKIITSSSTVLPASMPYKIVIKGARYAALPGLLQNTMTFSFGTNSLGGLVNPITLPYAKLNNHKVTLSFKPATQADEDALLALLPEGDITDPSQLPSSIPGYLISVIPEVAVGEQVVASGNPLHLGEDLDFGYKIWRRGQSSAKNYRYNVTAGSYLNITIASGSVSPSRLSELQTKLTATKTILESGDAALIAGLTREDVLGDMFYAGGLGYWSQLLAISHIQGLANQTSFNLPNGYGTFGYVPDVAYLFGLPNKALESGGVVFNLRTAWNNIPKDGDMSKWKGLNLQAGTLMSTLEHAIPELMFNTDPANPVEGVSAVKALQIAAQQGQRIYHITQQNRDTVLPQLNLGSLARTEIIQGLNAGKEVITHTDQISVPGWTGEGYIITDPETGAGAYKISGGGNGGFINAAILYLLSIWDAIASFALNNYSTVKGITLDLLVGIFKTFDALENCGKSPAGGILAFLIASFTIVSIGTGVVFVIAFTGLIGAIAGFLVAVSLALYTKAFEEANCQPL